LLSLMVNALYSNREIFLRELVSNASDACDRLRFAALTDESLKGLDQDLAIDISLDETAGTLTIRDNGIGMNREEVIENIGTIARSGTRRFLESLSGDRRKDAQLIGQFGVGFYSAFVVADSVTLETRKAGDTADAGIRWTSDGQGEYTLDSAQRPEQGTEITLTFKEDHRDLLNPHAIRRIIERYSNHIAFPIRLAGEEETDTVNDSQALWARPKSELGEDDYTGFYTSLTGDPEKPLSWAHHHVEGSQQYSLLLYVPGRAPFDLMVNRDEREGLKLYIQRVFIMDAAEELLPRYLRFMRGVVDASDLPLNVSREILQESELLDRIRQTVIKRSLDMLEKLAGEESEWDRFWEQFGPVLKEGVVEDPANQERLAALLRFDSTRDGESRISLDDYIAGMAEDEDTIWYLTADNLKAARSSPHLESFRKNGTEVLLLTDRIDEWLTAHLGEYKGKQLRSVSRGRLETDEKESFSEDDRKLAGRVKKALDERVGDVRPSSRLTESPSCAVVDESALSLQMQKMLRQAGQEVPENKPDMEINPTHPLVRRLASETDDKHFAELAHLLLDQALLAEGGELADPAAYVRRVNDLLVRTLDS